jgi:hypothetical protein
MKDSSDVGIESVVCMKAWSYMEGHSLGSTTEYRFACVLHTAHRLVGLCSEKCLPDGFRAVGDFTRHPAFGEVICG